MIWGVVIQIPKKWWVILLKSLLNFNQFIWAGAKQPVHSFLGGKGLGIQQGTNVWDGLSKSVHLYVTSSMLTTVTMKHNMFAEIFIENVMMQANVFFFA